MSYPNEEQQAVLRQLFGTLLVLAPAGTGKTRIMANRLAAVIAAGIPPGSTLGVTFTNRAAEQMRNAVRDACGSDATECRIQTFHSLCAWMLRLEARDLGLPSDFVIYDEQDSIDLLRDCLTGTGIGPDSAFWQLSQIKSDCPPECLTLGEIPALNLSGLAEPYRKAFRTYHEHLAERHALDFPDLLYRTRAMLAILPDKRKKWADRFQWIQMDEVQDTHLSEYEVIRLLATHATGIAFFGDLDQTIYEWRGSKPDEVMKRVKADFGPVTELPLLDNYRATKSLLRVSDRHAATFADRRTRIRPAPSLPEGIPPECQRAENSTAEAEWIASRIRRILADPDSGRIGILTRTHKRSECISRALSRHHVPHLTVEQFDFFRRQEIKDLLARLRLLLNAFDSGSLQRLTQRPASGIGAATLHKLWIDGQQCGLRITDLAQVRSHYHDEPFHTLLDALANGTVVVFDVETTGLSPADDEVIDLGAVKLVAGRQVAEFDALLRPSRPIGDSAAVHGISEETLLTEGRNPAEVFREFGRFADGAVLVGHNVGFDLTMIRAHAARLGVPLPTAIWDDTLDLARRFLRLERHDLANVSRHLGTQSRPSHRALADARPTAEVLMHLARLLGAGSQARKELIARYGHLFQPIAEQLEAWRELATTLRPAALCRRILDESGLLDHYCSDTQRLANLERFVQFFAHRDEPARPPADMLGELTRRVALSRNLDFLATDDHSIPILTVHQSKGLEFDTVFVAGLTEDEFPSYYAKKDGKLEEERRLFYVAITRAKRHLILTSHALNDSGYEKPPSSFIARLI
ncbi:MAG: UvrD-helicase domain-containing protein [Verrucomicrobia bacterium]|nr:UvrD-helicase domain-containing protein [Verrucomicrobiota bacterium]